MLTTESPLSGSTSVPDLLLPRLPRPDTFNPDLFTVLLFQAHAQGRPALTDFHLAQMVQTLAWCHGSDRGHPRLTGSTIDGRHYVTIPHTAWLSTCPDLTRSTLNRVLSICSEDLPDDRRAGGLFITRRSVHGLMHSLDLDLLRRWYHEAHVTESRLTDTLSHHRPSSVRHDHDLCDVLNLTGAGGSMLGLMLRQLAWWQGSDQGHVPRLAGRQLSGRVSLRSQDAGVMAEGAPCAHSVGRPPVARRGPRGGFPSRRARSAQKPEHRWPQPSG